MGKAPVVLFVYNRLEHTKKTIESLKLNKFAKETDLFIFSDGAKDEKALSKVIEVREYIHSIDGFRKIYIIERNKNFGLAKNIIMGVTRIVNRYGKVIVLEDDIVTSVYFLDYMNKALDKYNGSDNVMSISGYCSPIFKDGLPETFFTPWFECWGWGTWKRSWDLFSRKPLNILKNTDRRMINHINMNGTDPTLWNQVIDNYRNTINTWAIFFHVAICKNNGLVLYPRDSLCLNIGFDGSGTHGSFEEESIYDVSLSNKEIYSFSEITKENEIAIERIMDYNKKRIALKDYIIFTIKKELFYYFKYGT